MNYYFDVLKKYAVFKGRAARKEYWMFYLFNIIISFILIFIGKVLGATFLISIYSLAILLPSIAVLARRLHDTNRSGWWILIGLIPFIGAIILIIFAVLDSQPGENRYGQNPKGATVATPGKNPFIVIIISIVAIALIMAAISAWSFFSITKNSRSTTTATSTNQ